MPVPSVITDLSTTAASNSPAGTDPPASTDDYLRAHASFIAQNYGNKLDKSGAVTPTANQPMGGYKHTGAGTATAAGNYVVWNQTGVKFPAMGIGTASSSWGGSGVYAVDIAARGAIYGNASSVSVAANTYYDGSNNRAKETAAGALLEVGAGTITAYTMASVSAGATQTLTSRLQIKANGQTRFLPLSSDPSGAEAGDVYYSSTTGGLRYYSGNSASWEDLPGAEVVTTVADTLSIVNPRAHISRVLQGADAARRVRPDATYSTVRYCTPAGAGAKDGTSLANAWGRAELNTALATLSNAHVYLSGTFEPEAYSTAGPLIGPVVGDNVRLDLATYGATVRGYSGATWTASGTNGEYYTTAANNQVSFRLTEDGVRMRGVSGSDCGAGMTITAIDATADTVTLSVYRELQANDEIVFISSTANGLTVGTKYYVKTATAASGGSQTLTLSATLGGATLDITGTLSGTKRMWSLVGGRDGDPVPGSLQAGEYAWAPDLSRVYMKPSSGTPSDHTYTWWQTGSTPSCITAGSAAVTDGLQIIGGEIYGAPSYGIFMGDGSAQGYVTDAAVYGTVVHSCESGIVSSGAENSDCQWNHVYDCTDHAIGSKNGTNNEAGLKLHYNWVHDLARQPWDSGDCQGLVTNPSTDDAWFHGNVVQRVGHQRDYTTHPLGLNDTVNTGAAVCDSSKRVVITGNYFEECYGETVEVGPNDVQAITQLLVAGNVFDQRNLLPALQETTIGSEQSAVIRVLVTSSATAGYGSDYTNVVQGNLVLLGISRSSTATSIDSAALAAVRNAKTGAVTEAKIKLRDNVVLALDPNYAWDMLAVRYTGTSSSVTGVDSDNNTYYSASASGRGAVIVANTNVGQSGATTVDLADLGDGTGWTSPDGTVSDKHSTVWTEAQMIANFADHATVRRVLPP